MTFSPLFQTHEDDGPFVMPVEGPHLTLSQQEIDRLATKYGFTEEQINRKYRYIP